MKYRVITHARAERDVRNTLVWLHGRSKAGAARWFTAYEAALRRISRNPEVYGLAHEAERFPDVTLREFLFKTRRGRVYRGVFVIDGDVIRVLRVLGPGRDLLSSGDVDT
jgi:plasmid stabilization system protein ParE